MHTYEGLASVPSQLWAKGCAERVALLHAVMGSATNIKAVLAEGQLLRVHTGKRDTTLAAESEIDEPGVYFYAGRSYPAAIGNAVLIAPPSVSASWHAKASPFDTGGVFHHYTALPWDKIGPKTERGYIERHTEPMARFREYFSRHLSAFFGSAADYWHAQPEKPIDGVLFPAGSDWRDWTFEVRCQEDVEIQKMDLYVTPAMNNLMAEMERSGQAVCVSPSNVTVDDSPGCLAERDAEQLGITG